MFLYNKNKKRLQFENPSYFRRNQSVPISLHDKACTILRTNLFQSINSVLKYSLSFKRVHSAGDRDIELISRWLGTAQLGTVTRSTLSLSTCVRSQPCFSPPLSPSPKCWSSPFAYHLDILKVDPWCCWNIFTHVIVSYSLLDTHYKDLAASVALFDDLTRRMTLSVNEVDASHYRIKCHWLYLPHNRIAYQVLCCWAVSGSSTRPSVLVH